MAPWGSRLLPTNSRIDSNPPSVEASPSPHRNTIRFTESDIIENASGIPSLPPPPHRNTSTSSPSKPTRTPSHGRSISQPFPSIFVSGTKRQQPPRRVLPASSGFDSTDDSDSAFPFAVRQGHHRGKGKQKVLDEDVKIGHCMTCHGEMHWPKELNEFRCTICATINDLKPVLIQVKDGRRIPIQGGRTAHPGSRFKQNVPPLNNTKTKNIINDCLTKYMLKRLGYDDGSTSSPTNSAPQSPTWNVQDHGHGVERRGRTSEEVTFDSASVRHPIRLSSRPAEQRVVTGELRKKFSFENNGPSSALYSTSTPGNFLESHMDQARRELGADSAEKKNFIPHTAGAGGEMMYSQKRPSVVQGIFRPLEDYIVTTFGSFECINVSFSSMRPNMAPRAASEGAPSLSPMPAPTRQPRAEKMSEMDAKTLLLGDFAENGSWWTGSRPDIQSPERSRTHRTSGHDHTTDMVTVRTPRIDWSALSEWYNQVISAGNTWRKTLYHLLDSEIYVDQMRYPTESDLDDMDEDIRRAQSCVREVLLKATESLLRRPGRPLTEPDHLRFLLIIFANPLLSPGMLKVKQKATSRSRSRSRESRVQSRSTHFEQRQQHIPVPSLNRLKAGKNTSGWNINIVTRLLGLIAYLPNECHHHLVSWFARYSDTQFQRMVELIGSFVTYRLICQQHEKKREVEIDPTAGLIPDMSGLGRNPSAALHAALGGSRQSSRKSDGKPKPVAYSDDWQVTAAARVMSILFSANNSGLSRGDLRPPAGQELGHSTGIIARDRAHLHGQILPISDFYNTLLDYSDLIADFEAWEAKKARFCFCQYSFFLSIGAKIKIMEHDARRQMEIKARDAFFDSIMNRGNANQYLVLNVRRDCLVEDSLKSVSEVVGSGSEDIKKGLRIEFRGEEGIDAGGLRKEWFLLLVRDVFNPEHGMFTYDDDSQFCYFNPNSLETTEEFFLVGVVLGLAIYNSTILDVALPPFAFRKLLAAAPTSTPGPTSHSKPLMTYSLEDLAEYRPALAAGLRQLLDFEGDVEATFCRDFVADAEKFGLISQVPLCPGGERRPVTNSNRREFVDLYVRYLLDTAVSRQFEPFKRGFFTVCGGNALSLFQPKEIELLVRGSDEPLDIASLRAVSRCENWGARNAAESEPVIQWFWSTFQSANPTDQRKLLTFITGSDRIPAMGAVNLVIKLSCLGDDSSRYPVARTCFNMLSLWRYSSRQKLERMLWRAVHESEGFGLK